MAKKEKGKEPAVKKVLHSDYQIRWKNFRRFEDTGWITLRPITLLIGANNSGKSSVLSPLLLLSQTISSSDSEAPLIPRGRLVDVGNYKDFINSHDESRELFLGLRFHSHRPEKGKIGKVGDYPPGAIELTFARGDEPQHLILKKYEVFDIFGRPYFSRALMPDGKYSLEGNISLKKMSAAEKAAITDASPVNFLFSPNQVLYALETPEDSDERVKVMKFSEPFSHYLRAVGFAFSAVRGLFKSMSYVGPLRRKIQRYYRVSAETPHTVGPQGENAPNLFRRQRAKHQPELNRWIKAFEFGDSLVCESVTDDLFKLSLQNGSETTNVADVGFGASQVLPLIIQALAAPEDSLTLAEQPEIHLNPRLQCVLAELFVQMAGAGHRVLVETHSEHLLTRLRTLVASGGISQHDVAVYFVERDGAASTIRQVEINENGHIDKASWPKGFFDDALRESLALASAQSKIARRH